MTEPASITCPQCGATSYAERDITEGYCGACHDWTSSFGELDMHGMSRERPMYFDRQGNAVTLGRWCWLTEHKFENDYYRIAEDEVDLYRVSTVWIGLDMGLPIGDLPRAPLIFETMTFLAGEGLECYRWATEAAAQAGHDRVVAEIKANIIREADK